MAFSYVHALVGVIALGVCASGLATAEELASQGERLAVLTTESRVLAQGYDSELRIPQPSCVQGTPADHPGLNTIQSQITHAYSVSTKTDMIRKATGGHTVSWTDILKFAGADASEITLSQYDANVIIETSIKMGARSIEYVKLSNVRLEQLTSGPQGERAFRAACGDQYVWTEYYEGRILGVLSITTSSKDHRFKMENEVAAELSKLKSTLPGVNTEPHRVCRRLQLLRGWSHDEQNDEQIFARGPGPCGAAGPGSRRRAHFALGGGLIDCGQDRLHGADAA